MGYKWGFQPMGKTWIENQIKSWDCSKFNFIVEPVKMQFDEQLTLGSSLDKN